MSHPSHPRIEKLRFLSDEAAKSAAQQFGTPLYIYDHSTLEQAASEALSFQAPFGLTVRYAMKANPLRAILDIFRELGIKIDASSGFEAQRAMKAGFEPTDIMITSQQIPGDLRELIKRGVHYNATSLHQLDSYGKLAPNSSVSIRLNTNIGSGHSNKTNTGGPTSSFGIWHEDLPLVQDIATRHNLSITKLHTHIGSGTHPETWLEAAHLTISLAAQLPEVTSISLGGGFKVGRMQHEPTADLNQISEGVATALREFAATTGRKLHLEIEPGTYLVARAGAILARAIDIVKTPEYTFLKLDTGLTEIMRPSLYGAQHPIITVPSSQNAPHEDYVVVGHTCESGDLLSPAPGDPDTLHKRTMQRAEIGDVIAIEATGAYCAAMSASGYNSFPIAASAMQRPDGTLELTSRPGNLEDLLRLEV